MVNIRYTREEQLLLWIVATGFFMQSLDTTIVNTALPSIAQSLDASPLAMQSVVFSYALAMASLIPASGWLADRFGTRPAFLVAILLFLIGSLASAFAPNLSFLVAARVVQGLGGALMIPVGRLAVLRSFPHEKFIVALTRVVIPGLVGSLIGPTLGGWIVQLLSWHWIFLINLPIGLLGIFSTLKWMPNIRLSNLARFDLSGFVMLTVAMLAISLALDGMGDLYLQKATILILLIIGLTALTSYCLHAVKVPEPLFSPKLFYVGNFRVGILGNFFARIGPSALPYTIPLMLQIHMGYNPAEAGMMLLPMVIAGMLSKPLAVRIISRFSYRTALTTNTIILGIVIAAFALVTQHELMWLTAIHLALFGAINSVQFTFMNAVTLKDLELEYASSGNTMLSMMQMLTMGIGVSVAGALLTTFQGWHEHLHHPSSWSAFSATFVCLGIITACSAWIFWQLHSEPSTPSKHVPNVTPLDH